MSEDILDELIDNVRVVLEGSSAYPVDGEVQQSENRSAAEFSTKTGNALEYRDLEISKDEFVPIQPVNLEETGLSSEEIEDLILKFLLNRNSASGKEIIEQLKFPRLLMDPMLHNMKMDQYVVYRGMNSDHDYIFQLTEKGRERARREIEKCTFFGAAPVPLRDYIESVQKQSVLKKKPTWESIEKCFVDIVISHEAFRRVGRAIHSGRGMFLFGNPGNGKTSIAERMTYSFGDSIWIPRTINVWGEIIRLYDPSVHFEVPLPPGTTTHEGNRIDDRWVRIKRPIVAVGGELTMSNLELIKNPETGINEAPVQLKSNCGTLLVDDFGRQQISTTQLLNRWIVPLEKRHDFLNLSSGRTIQVPFDQQVIFSTNLEPRELVDEAFLRRIPYKIHIEDPSEEQFRGLFKKIAADMEFECTDEVVDYLIDTHYKSVDRQMRFCHARDLMMQIESFCTFEERPFIVDEEAIDAAAENYLKMMSGAE